MRLTDKYIIFSSVFALFSEDFNFHYIIDWKIFYVILFSNSFLLLKKRNLYLNKNVFILLFFFLIHGIILFIWFKNPIQSLFAQLLGIGITSVFYYSFIKTYSVKQVYKAYLSMAILLAILAIPMYYLNINVKIDGRLNGILSEPAHYAAVMLPAAYFFLLSKKYIQFLVIVLTIILSNSSIGYLGLALIFVIPLIRVKYFLQYAIIVMTGIIISGYYIKSHWNDEFTENAGSKVVKRIKQTYESFGALSTGNFNEDINLSSYALMSNAFIASNGFINSPLGTGLGSYQYQYEKYYPLMSPPGYLLELKQSKINKLDANSLFLRILVDLGIFGVFLIGYFAYRSIKVFKKDNQIIQQSIFFYLLIKIIREGHYFSPELYFFVLIFVKNDLNENSTHS